MITNDQYERCFRPENFSAKTKKCTSGYWGTITQSDILRDLYSQHGYKRKLPRKRFKSSRTFYNEKDSWIRRVCGEEKQKFIDFINSSDANPQEGFSEDPNTNTPKAPPQPVQSSPKSVMSLNEHASNIHKSKKTRKDGPGSGPTSMEIKLMKARAKRRRKRSKQKAIARKKARRQKVNSMIT